MGEINRRAFMQTAGALAAGAALYGAMPRAQAGELTGKIKLAVKYGMVGGGGSVKEKFALVKEVGYDGIEPTVGDMKDPEEFKAASEETGLPIHGVVNGSVENIPRAIDYAKLVGANSVLLVAGRVNDETYYADNWNNTQSIIREALPYAAEHQIQLLVENVWNGFLQSPLEFAYYLDELDSEWVGAYLDLGNMIKFGYAHHWIPALGHRVKKLDIKEYSIKKLEEEGLWKGFEVEIGDGSVNWAKCREELAKINYSGWGTLEVSGGDRERLAMLLERSRKVLDL